MGKVRCPHCQVYLDSDAYPAHESTHVGLTTSPIPFTRPRDDAIGQQPIPRRTQIPDNLSLQDESEPREFVIVVTHSQSGREFSPFIVRAKDDLMARKLCQRNYLVVRSVEPYVEDEGKKKPRVLPFGPPVSDKDFEADYGNREPDATSVGSDNMWVYVLSGFLMGPIGVLLSLLADVGSKPRRRDG